MGTSKGYVPPTGFLWPDAKRSVTNMAKNNFSASSVGQAVSNFSKAITGSGGNGRATNSIASAGAKAVHFIDLVKRYGIYEALEQVGLKHLVHKNPEELLLGLLDYFSDSGNSLYDNIAQQSINELMREILANVKTEEEYNETLSSINTEEFIREFIIKFIQNSFFTNFSEKLIGLFEDYNKYNEAERAVRTFIRTRIESDYTIEQIQNIDWTGDQGKKIIQEKCDKAFEILSVWSEALV
jgi:hypothetical protein